MVPLASALGRHADPALTLNFDPTRVWVARGTNHLDLLSRRAVYARIKGWLSASFQMQVSGTEQAQQPDDD